MHETLSAMVEEEQRKREAAEKEALDVKSRFAEMEAMLKVKDAEIAEAKVSRPSPNPANHLDLAWTRESGI